MCFLFCFFFYCLPRSERHRGVKTPNANANNGGAGTGYDGACCMWSKVLNISPVLLATTTWSTKRISEELIKRPLTQLVVPPAHGSVTGRIPSNTYAALQPSMTVAGPNRRRRAAAACVAGRLST